MKKDTKQLITEIVVDGNNVASNKSMTYKGMAAVSFSNSSRLLIDYKAEHPDTYNEIMNTLFKEDYGAGFTHIRLEMGADNSSFFGTEPSIKRFLDEEADLKRVAGWTFANDAKTINPDLTIGIFKTDEPDWVKKAFNDGKYLGYLARYKWYKEHVDGAYDSFAIQVDYISINEDDADWIIYFATKLKNELNQRYDYSNIKIIYNIQVKSHGIEREMLKNKALCNAIDVIGISHNAINNEIKLLHAQHDKELWLCDGKAPYVQSKYAVNYGDKSGLSGLSGALDTANNIISALVNNLVVEYEFSPAVSAYYDGTRSYPNALISAPTPWNEHFHLNPGVWIAAHFSRFIKRGWQYVNGACFSGAENELEKQYVSAVDHETGNCSIVISNNSDRLQNFVVTIKNLDRASSAIYKWETAGPDNEQKYDTNWFKLVSTIYPKKNRLAYKFSVQIKPYSIVTLTTLRCQNNFSKFCYDDEILKLPYKDDFDYADYPADYLEKRANMPRYSFDQSGLFEIKKINDKNVLIQILTDTKSFNPNTLIGDDRWADYSVETDIILAENGTDDNYCGVGMRCNSCMINKDTFASGYYVKVYQNGKWELMRSMTVLGKGRIENFNSSSSHHLKLYALHKTISLEVGYKRYAEITEENVSVSSGRVSLISAYFNNAFKNLYVEQTSNFPYVKRIDALENGITYSGDYSASSTASSEFYNRTKCILDKNASFEFSFKGTGFALIGENFDASVLKVQIDNNEPIEISTSSTLTKECFYSMHSLSLKKHSVNVSVSDGTCILDVVEYFTNKTIIKELSDLKETGSFESLRTFNINKKLKKFFNDI